MKLYIVSKFKDHKQCSNKGGEETWWSRTFGNLFCNTRGRVPTMFLVLTWSSIITLLKERRRSFTMFTLTCNVCLPAHAHFHMEVGTIIYLISKTHRFSSFFGSTSYSTTQDNCTNLEGCNTYMIPRSREIAHV